MKTPFDLINKKVTIIGAARSGVAVANVVVRLGGSPKISESKPLDQIQSQLKALTSPNSVEIESGGHTQVFIQASDYVVLSPGVRQDALPVQWARARGIEVMGEVEFAYRLCPSPIVAVTGSNGKTTTVSLIAAILKKAGRGMCLCGNIGSPLSAHVLDLKPSDTVVLEISSFQLESTIHFKPHIAVWTNFSQNHLDRHRDLAEYFEAKMKIFKNQDNEDIAVLNFAQVEHREVAEHIKPRVLFFNDQAAKAVAQGMENPNVAAAMQVARALGIGDAVCHEVFNEFKGVEHRLEFVRALQGVEYINDSKSTTVEAGRWALERAHQPLIIICGGKDKHSDYAPLKSLVAQKVKCMVAIGEAREIMKDTFGDVVEVVTCASFEDAINTAKRKATVGDCVILSPMCASFDMFNNFEHRGQVFKELVHRLG